MRTKAITFDFNQVNTVNNLKSLIPRSHDWFDEFIDSQDRKRFQKEIILRKKSKRHKEFRTVYKIKDEYKRAFKLIRNALNDISPALPFYVNGFIKGRSAKSNASLHINKKIIFKTDIKNFFGTIDIKMVNNALLKLNINSEVASYLSSILTFEGRLPQGYSTSCLLSNIVSINLDEDLYRFALENNITYSRYGDDITFSGNYEFDIKIKVFDILIKHNFETNENKTMLKRRGQPQYVTGLSISDCIEHPNLPKRFKKKLRLQIYYILKFGLKKHCEKLGFNDESSKENYYEKLNGNLAYASGVDPSFKKYLSILQNEFYEMTSLSC